MGRTRAAAGRDHRRRESAERPRACGRVRMLAPPVRPPARVTDRLALVIGAIAVCFVVVAIDAAICIDLVVPGLVPVGVGDRRRAKSHADECRVVPAPNHRVVWY